MKGGGGGPSVGVGLTVGVGVGVGSPIRMDKTLHDMLPKFLLVVKIGFGIGVLVHLVSLFGVRLPDAITIVVHIAALITAAYVGLASANLVQGHSPADWVNLTTRGGTVWMRKAITGLLAYAIVNFLLCMIFGSRSYTDSPFTGPYGMRLASGAWMVVFAISYAVLYSKQYLEEIGDGKVKFRCPNGHVVSVSPSELYCQVCGKPLSDMVQ